jgi:hypothetical protein
MTRPAALLVSIDTRDYHGGYAVSINGVQIAHRPYDGSSAEEVEHEVIEALGELLRRETGWPQRAPEEDD